MTVNETMALLQLSKTIVCFRHAAEEVAGLDPLGNVTDDIIPGSDIPTPTFVSKELVTTLSHQEPGILGHKAADMASIIISNQHPPTWIGEDNQGTVNVVNHVSAQNKSLKRITRVISHVMSLIDEQLIQVQLVPASEQEADQLSKPCISPVDEWRKNENLLGSHPDMTAMIQVVNKKFNKRLKITGVNGTEELAGMNATEELAGMNATEELAGMNATEELTGVNTSKKLAGVNASEELTGVTTAKDQSDTRVFHGRLQLKRRKTVIVNQQYKQAVRNHAMSTLVNDYNSNH